MREQTQIQIILGVTIPIIILFLIALVVLIVYMKYATVPKQWTTYHDLPNNVALHIDVPNELKPKASVIIADGGGNNLFQIAALVGFCYQYNLHPVIDKDMIGLTCYKHSKELYFDKLIHGLDYETIGKKFVSVTDREPSIEYKALSFTSNKNKHVLNGYFQSPKYFPKREILQQYIYPKQNIVDELRKKYESLLTPSSIGIHIRRGDYKLAPQFMLARNELYYEKALDVVSKMIRTNDKIQVVIFTNDHNWSKTFLEQRLPVELSELFLFTYIKEDDYKELILLSMMNYIVISNSTFSWWSAWLAGDKATVISPFPWISTSYSTDIYIPNWIKLMV